jgi:lysosomal acid phosphatase
MLLSKVLGVIVIARNGDRYNYYQDPKTYAASNTETTALGVVRVTFPLCGLISHGIRAF